MRLSIAVVLTLAANAAPAANYFECVAKDYKTRWASTPCNADEKQTEYDGKTKKPVESSSKRPAVGMSKDDVRNLPLPWSRPTDVNRTTTQRGTREQWVYQINRWSAYVYFDEGGTVTAVSD